MKHIGPHFFRSMRLLCMGAVAWSCIPALAAGDPAAADAGARYQRERAVCISGQSNQERATCLREAGAAYTQMRKGGVQAHDRAFEQNAQSRCQALPNDDRQACLARMQGHGSSSGSVSGGGILRELTTTEAAAPNGVQPAAQVPLPAPKQQLAPP